MLESDNADVGDAPISYGNPSHTITGIRLGASVDADPSLLNTAAANGDDANNTNDENGVTLTAPFLLSGTTAIPVNVQNASGFLNVWIDWNADGDFIDGSEQIISNQAVAVGVTNLNVAVPSSATVGTTFARFRVCTNNTALDNCSTPANTVQSGEVEDYQITLEADDFGDLPDTGAGVSAGNYETLFANGGARHKITTGVRIGAAVDFEGTGVPRVRANGDDLATDDEEYTPPIVAANATSYSTGSITVANSGLATNLCGFYDANADGDFADAGETSSTAVANGATSVALNFSGLAAVTRASYLRLRLIAPAEICLGIGPNGASTSGEVEDYVVPMQSDFGDLPDSGSGSGASNYESLNANGGASHRVIPGLFLGTGTDGETDAQQNAAANGDDGLTGDDEDGLVSVTYATTGNSCSAVTLRFNATAPNGESTILNVFVDRNGDGDFSDPSETGSATFIGSDAPTPVDVVLPARSTADCNQPFTTGGIVGIRARLALAADTSAVTSATAAALQGSAVNSGEVEDYNTTTTGTVPVTLSKVSVREIADALVVEFNVASEAGTLGYRILGDMGNKNSATRIELASVQSEHIDRLTETSYSARVRAIGVQQIWIEERSVDGKAELYGPYAVGASIGESDLTRPLDWQVAQTEQDHFRTMQQNALRASSHQAAEVAISESAWINISDAELQAAGVNLHGAAADQIAVSRGSALIPVRVYNADKAWGQTSSLGFYAQAVQDSLYTKTAIYRIERGAGLVLGLIDNNAGVIADVVDSVPDTLIVADNKLYSFSSPIEDPWFYFRAIRNGNGTGSVSVNFDLPHYLASSKESISLRIWGGLDYPDLIDDHHAVFKLNGQEIGQQRFAGFAAMHLQLELPADVLRAGSNTLTMELPASTGGAADIVNVESFSIDYQRQLRVSKNQLNVTLPSDNTSTLLANSNETDKGANNNRSAIRIDGITGKVIALLQRGTEQFEINQSLHRGSLYLSLPIVKGDRLLIQPITVANKVQPAAAINNPVAAPASYLIISHPSFIGGLTVFVAAKQAQGFAVKVVDVEAIYRYYNAGVVDPVAIEMTIRQAKQNGVTHVLLVGGDSYDYHNVLGINSISFLPTPYRRTDSIIAYAPADSDYADVDQDGKPDLALGRWPVRTHAELESVIAKTLSYQERRKAVMVNDRSLNGLQFNQAAAPLQSMLGPNWLSVAVDLDQYHAGQAPIARSDVVNRLQQGASLLSYYGHSAPSSWSREGLLTANMVNGGLFDAVPHSFATVQLGCWATYFVEPTSNTVAHAMLLNTSGAAAVLGASALTQTSSDQNLAAQLLPQLGQYDLGVALQSSLRALSEEPANRDITIGGTLLGDPSLR